MPLHRFIKPMKAESGSLVTHDGWAAEIKWDGMRLQLHVGGGQIRAYSGSGRDVTVSFPELGGLADAPGADAILDAEAVVFDGDRPSFGRLQHRIHNREPTAALLAEKPVVFIIFDLLELDGNSLLELAYRDRRRLLLDLLDEGPSWRVPAHSENGGAELLALAQQRDLEGIVLKRLDSPYRPGQRSSDWIKVKIRKRQEFVVGGWIEGSGGLVGSIGSLVVGVYDQPRDHQPAGSLIPAGSVGSGLTDADRGALADVLLPGPRPFASDLPTLSGAPHWVEPTVVVEVEYSLWSNGDSLWHPVYRGLRVDREPTDVVRED